MAKALYSGPMGRSMWESSCLIKEKGMEISPGRMAVLTKDYGEQASSMERASTFLMMAERSEEYGRMAEE